MKKKIVFIFVLLLAGLAAVLKDVAATAVHPILVRGGIQEVDTELRITYPVIGSRVRGKIVIRGKAKRNSYVQVSVSSTYYRLGKNMQQQKVYKGAGPIKGETRTVKIKANGQGIWTTDAFTFNNRGWSEEFKIVARSVEGKNATYVTVKDENRPIVQWD